jgi:predicted GNAT family acetyltransferase
MTHLLDRPVWRALTTCHADVSEGNSLARRYLPSIVPFVATANNGAESLRSLKEVLLEDAVMLQAEEIVVPAGLQAVSQAEGVQMVAEKPLQIVSDSRIERLAEDDAAAMLALATLTRPGPFSLRALMLGEFWGVRVDGRLVAMAGERMKLPGYTELSGVCSHPDVRGLGFGRLLSLHVAQQIIAKGDRPFLHAYATNTPAIALYESIGFEQRARVNVAVIRRLV